MQPHKKCKGHKHHQLSFKIISINENLIKLELHRQCFQWLDDDGDCSDGEHDEVPGGDGVSDNAGDEDGGNSDAKR